MRPGLAAIGIVVAAAGCSFQASFDGQFACDDTRPCPGGLTCSAGSCQPAGTSDGGSEPMADGGASGFSCAALDPAPAFCADFDQGGPIEQGWTIVYECIVADTDVFLSPPRAVAASVTATSKSCALRTTVSADESIRLAVDVRMDALAAKAINVVRIDWRGETHFLRLTDSGAFLAEDWADGFQQTALSSYPPEEQWFRLTLEVVVAGNTSTAELRFDDTVVGSRPVRAHLDTASEATITIGTLSGQTTAGDGLIRYDNAVVYAD